MIRNLGLHRSYPEKTNKRKLSWRFWDDKHGLLKMTQIYLHWRVQTPWLKVWMSNIVQPLIIPPQKKLPATLGCRTMCKSFVLTYRWALTNKKSDPIRTNVTSSKHHVHVYVTVYTYVYTYSIQPIKPCKTYFSISNQNISSSSKMRGKFLSKPLHKSLKQQFIYQRPEPNHFFTQEA